MNAVIQKAIKICGTQVRLAEQVGVTQKTISMWLHGAEISARYIPDLVLATGGAVSAAEVMQSLRKN